MEACMVKRINFAAEQKLQIHQYMMRIKNIYCCAILKFTIRFIYIVLPVHRTYI